ncbi:MAG: hypothetical protein E5W91_29475 [Mesorhizobium sp.]|uniref:AAA family ATPase n=1 Tax=Mesorhizobium sp. TaxID=1871066 RepID=UPI0012062401|nr:AAA family ATPase [Mesorhizobium sp.]TIS53787.1 MAG: hypothetical protein E5W91_29475 [Mesorhizobium sp.]
MSIIKNLRSLKSAAVLAERTARSDSLGFARFNLIYGFNGSGKSTLSRIYSTLQQGRQHQRLPEGCTFEIEMDDGKIYRCPDQLGGIEQRICVFNADFVDENLQWGTGRANPVFYIGQEQAELAGELSKLEQTVPTARQKQTGETKVATEKEKAFGLLKRERARAISDRLRLTGRKYEAPNLASDYETVAFNADSVLLPKALDDATSLSARSAPLPKVTVIEFDDTPIEVMASATADFAGQTIGSVLIAELERYPAMVPWMKAGHEFHIEHDLESCLYCGETIPEQRKKLLTAAFDDRLATFIESVADAHRRAEQILEALTAASGSAPEVTSISPELQTAYQAARSLLVRQMDAASDLMKLTLGILRAKLATPTAIVENRLPPMEKVRESCNLLKSTRTEVNNLIVQHNEQVDDFARHQEEARLSIRRHFLAEGASDYADLRTEVGAASMAADEAKAELTKLLNDIETLKAKVREHGPAAARVNELVKSYLGHGELTISPIAEGYELHRHSQLVRGAPSEGEKTAIALCYFLSTLESDGRKLEDVIVVIDDPISSLDTKAMNFACALIRNRVSQAAQLFVLTHNQHCMNEFKKAWKGWAYPRNKDTAPTARLLYVDVSVPTGTNIRSSSIIEMPPLLREYDSEYHFLFQKVLQFEAAGAAHSDYAFMMPNVIRRVLDVFLAFRMPRNGPLIDKIKELCKGDTSLDVERMIALERLSQVESHSDSLDDLVTHSSMTVEEAHDANAALLVMMEKLDSEHLKGLRKYCRLPT